MQNYVLAATKETPMTDLVLVGHTCSSLRVWCHLLTLAGHIPGDERFWVYGVAYRRASAEGWVPCARVSLDWERT